MPASDTPRSGVQVSETSTAHIVIPFIQLLLWFTPPPPPYSYVKYKHTVENVNSDIEVLCGSHSVDLQILLCPVYFNGYNESLLALNSEHSKQQCKGTPDWTVDPPVVKFNFSITEEAITACSSKLTINQEVGTGVFADFSHVQYINISGMICSKDPTTGAITYHQEVMYRFSCRYPLQYLVNNTQMSVSGVSLAVKDNNGSFISTLSMRLYSDNSYSSALQIPPGGLELKTRIFVEVRASNLTNRFNVLLDRCYATTSPFPINTTFHDLFVGCDRDGQTVMGVNGEQQEARFSFEAFRFVQDADATLSTYYVHCATRLCVNSFCPTLTQNCTTGTNSRRRRSTSDSQGTTVSDTATISSGPIFTRLDNGTQQIHMNSTVLAVSVIAGIVGTICLTLVAFIVYQKYNSNIILNKTVLYPQE
ncbi:zona pellucida-like domain-containing protein 1 isoform X1 [Lates japonicus]|uniref:Zona pellucida-like domain-containing protein 1 isoform X1 n=1 Tax=Lates japonicus TaxID=270547 RepID=A0AAD3M4T6_LATJO|nr:zona pellucida-like domain-containing protein 1 isoform X1 [Lates japonicus]